MRSLICGIILSSLVVGCAKTADYDVVKIPKADSEQADDGAVVEEDVEAQVTPAMFKVGDPAPTFSDLIGVDDKNHSLDEFKDAKAIAVVFTCNKCPVAIAYEDRLNQYQKDYEDKGVRVIAINVNKAEADRLPAMKERAQEKGFAFPYLFDESQKSARAYGAKVTPHIFLLNTERKLVYSGPVDDNMEESQVTQKYLRDATDAVLAGKPVETASIDEPPGCGIQYE